jgi:hypothetical protein
MRTNETLDDTLGATVPRAIPTRVLLAGVDTIYCSCDASISDEMRQKLAGEKQIAQFKAAGRAVHCPEWLGARVASQGARGGYAFLLETEDFSVKLLGEHIVNRPGIYIELRSHFLHTHTDGPRGHVRRRSAGCANGCSTTRTRPMCGQGSHFVRPSSRAWICTAIGRAGIPHAGWRLPGAAALHPARKDRVGFYGQGLQPTSNTFGRGEVQARLYNKSLETREKANDAYAALLTARVGEAFDPTLDVWRLEFQLRREGVKGFRLYAPPEVDDEEAEIEAELAAEDLQHIGTLPRFFARLEELWRYLTEHWLRLVLDDGTTANRSRLPTHPTWEVLREGFAAAAAVAPLQENEYALVRAARHSGRARILRRLSIGVVKSLEVEDASPTSAAFLVLQKWAEQVTSREAERADARRARYLERQGYVPSWVERGMGERLARAEQVRHRVQMLLGIFSARGGLPLAFKPAHSVGDLLTQHLEELEQESEMKGGVDEVLAAHFARIYKVQLPRMVVALPAA